MIIITGQRVLANYFNFVQCFTIVAMMSQIFALIGICQALFMSDKSLDQSNITPQYEEWAGWLSIELWVMLSIIGSNSMFLFLRSLFDQRIVLKVPGMQQNEKTDFLESQ